MPPNKKKKKSRRPAPPQDLFNWDAVHKAAAFLEKAKLGDYVQLMTSPWRNIWVNFLAGLARGAGIVVGTVLLGGLVVILTVQSLKYVAKHSDMVPWFGDQVREAVGFILEVADQKLDDLAPEEESAE